jgi:hypothetical protein
MFLPSPFHTSSHQSLVLLPLSPARPCLHLLFLIAIFATRELLTRARLELRPRNRGWPTIPRVRFSSSGPPHPPLTLPLQPKESKVSGMTSHVFNENSAPRLAPSPRLPIAWAITHGPNLQRLQRPMQQWWAHPGSLTLLPSRSENPWFLPLAHSLFHCRIRPRLKLQRPLLQSLPQLPLTSQLPVTRLPSRPPL